MANQSSSSSVIFQNKVDRRAKGSNIAIGLSNDSLVLKKKDSTRILGSEMINVNQDHKRRCLEKLMTKQNVEDVKCSLEVEVIDDTALIETTAAVTRFKNRHRNEIDLGFGKNPGNKEENGGKKKRNKGFKKQGIRYSMKCLNGKKPNVHVVEDKTASKKQIPDRKMSAKVKYVYQKKDTKKVDVSLKVSVGDEKESETVNEKDDGLILNPQIDVVIPTESEDENASASTNVESKKTAYTRVQMDTVKYVYQKKAIQETDVNLKVSVGDERESETVNEKNDGLILNPQIDVLNPTESEAENVSANTDVESKKTAYTRVEMEALRCVDEPGQRTKWTEVFGGFGPSVAREYTGLVADANNRPTQRFNRVVNCGSGSAGSTRYANNPILGMPPVIPLCSSSNHRKFDCVGSRVSFN